MPSPKCVKNASFSVLDPETTLFFDDNAQNIRAAEKYGYNATKVDGRSGLNGREEITPP